MVTLSNMFVPKIACFFFFIFAFVSPSISKRMGASLNLLPETCGEQVNDRIIGGEETKLDEFPWMALLYYNKSEKPGFYCGGILISEKYVLTAAHCVGNETERKQLLSVRLGEYDITQEKDCIKILTSVDQYCSDKPVDILIEDKIIHENHDPKKRQNDIALLRLAESAPNTDFIRPICVARKMYAGDLYAAGWGRNESNTGSNVKLKVKLPSLNREACSDKLFTTLIEGQICAGGKIGEDACRGDSGGPLMIKPLNRTVWYVVGIVSYGPDCAAKTDLPSVYTDVKTYRTWIRRNLKP